MTTYISFVHNERFMPCKTPAYTVYCQTHFDATTVTRAYSTTAQLENAGNENMTGHYNRHMYNKLQLPHLSILFTFTGGKHLLTDRFVSSRVARLFQACSASHLSHPLRNSRAYVVCHSPRWSTSARHPMEGARSAMACYWNANWQDNSSFKCIK